jgi:hypothetical protein
MPSASGWPRRVRRLTDWVSDASSRQVADTAAEISEKGLEPSYPLNGVLHAAHALGYKPDILGSVWLLRSTLRAARV